MTKRVFVSTATLAILVFAAANLSYAQTASARCNDELIRGDYGFTIEGTKIGGPGPFGPMMGVAMTTFNGDGSLTQVDSVVIGGVHIGDFTDPQATGTYRVHPDCTGTFTINFSTTSRPPVTVDFVVTQNGDEIDTVVAPPPGAVGAVVTRSIGKRRFTNHSASQQN